MKPEAKSLLNLLRASEGFCVVEECGVDIFICSTWLSEYAGPRVETEEVSTSLSVFSDFSDLSFFFFFLCLYERALSLLFRG